MLRGYENGIIAARKTQSVMPWGEDEMPDADFTHGARDFCNIISFLNGMSTGEDEILTSTNRFQEYIESKYGQTRRGTRK